MDMPRYFYKNTYHHLYNRGVDKKKIFFDEKDYLYFMRKMTEYKKKYLIKILCYCLMPNHFHLYVKQTEDTGISEFIRDLINAYTRGTNVRYKSKGFLFESKTKSKIITEDEYYRWICKYILINPVTAGLVNTAEDWEYSSAKEYFGLKEEGITDIEEILSKYKNTEDLKTFIKTNFSKFDCSVLF